ncbi:MAG: cupin domain-containing protein [Solirubrobacterales bacterium]|nr:cupin domain-containing protein [Solirubrobacterales bacterium]
MADLDGMTSTEDATRVYQSDDREWIPMPLIPKGEAWIKVIHADPELRNVIFKFRFSPGCELTQHTHHCHAIAYTISGEWEYEGLKLPTGAVAYEPVASTHTPSSGPGSELVVFLRSDDDRFIVNHVEDGSDIAFDMGFFQAMEGITAADAAALTEQIAAGAGGSSAE